MCVLELSFACGVSMIAKAVTRRKYTFQIILDRAAIIIDIL
jgi:hypothetical protein